MNLDVVSLVIFCFRSCVLTCGLGASGYSLCFLKDRFKVLLCVACADDYGFVSMVIFLLEVELGMLYDLLYHHTCNYRLSLE